MIRPIAFVSALIVAVAFTSTGCQQTKNEVNDSDNKTIKILATTTIIEDLLKNIGGDGFEYSTLMGPGVDPHIYKPTQGDLKKLKNSDVIFFNGLYLEGKMTDILVKMRREKKVLAASDALDKSLFINDTEFDDGFDPHFWFDVSMWSEVAGYFATQLIELDPSQETIIKQNLATYQSQLVALNEDIINLISAIPESRRFVITSHDALNYFARKYSFQVRSLQGRSTAGELGLKDIREMVDFLTQNQIKAIFPENITGSQSLQAVIDGCAKKGHTVVMGEELFSDALGGPDSEAPDYLSMLKINTERIVNALK